MFKDGGGRRGTKNICMTFPSNKIEDRGKKKGKVFLIKKGRGRCGLPSSGERPKKKKKGKKMQFPN